MQALAAEMTKAFSRRLESLGVVVKELTGDMQLTKRELEETQVKQRASIVTIFIFVSFQDISLVYWCVIICKLGSCFSILVT